MSADAHARDEFAALVRLVIDPVSAYLARRADAATADDVLSETLVVLWRRFGEVPPGAEIAWAVGVARLQLKNAERSRRRREALIDRVTRMDAPDHAPAAYAVEGSDPGVAHAMSALRSSDAEMLRLWAWEDFSPAEIASVLGITANAAAIRLHRAKHRFAVAYRKRTGPSGHNESQGGGTT